MDRRTFLRASMPAALVGLAGCSGGDGTPTPGATDSPTATPTDTPTDSPTPTATDTPADSSTPTESRTPTDTQAPTETPAATESSTPTDTPTATATATPVPDLTVAVGPEGRVVFDPETFTIGAGDTVLWEWVSGGHNVSPDDGGQPAGADWAGDDDGTFGSGHTYAYTFDTPGEYSYHCDPHQSVGMRGSFTVE
jgi:plastocyanin